MVGSEKYYAMKRLNQFFYFLFSFLFVSCNLLKEGNAYELKNSKYKSTTKGTPEYFWVQFNDTAMILYPFQNKKEVNKNNPHYFSFNENSRPDSLSFLNLSKFCFDIDVLTIPFKYRPSVKNFPNQLNTNFSGGVYAGFRNDFYHFYFSTDPVGGQKRELKHFGLGIGLFSGIGSSAINPWTTQNQVQSEYDGFVFMNGVAGIIAVNKLTFGLCAGIDILLDKNKSVWIYQHKPWMGLTVGLNIN